MKDLAFQKLLTSSPEEWQRRAQQVDVSSPESIDAEQHFWRTLIEKPHPTHEPKKQTMTTEDTRFGWRWISLLSTWQSVSSVAALGLILWMVWNPWESKIQDVLQAKGYSTILAKPASEPLLHLGLWKGSTRSLKRLSPGDSSQPSDSLVFGFFLKQPGGYISIFYQTRLSIDSKKRQGRSKLVAKAIYPFASLRPKRYNTTLQLQLLASQGHLLKYSLQSLRGLVRVLLIQTQKPIDTKEIGACLPTKAWDKASIQRALQTCKTTVKANVEGVALFPFHVKNKQ